MSDDRERKAGRFTRKRLNFRCDAMVEVDPPMSDLDRAIGLLKESIRSAEALAAAERAYGLTYSAGLILRQRDEIARVVLLLEGQR